MRKTLPTSFVKAIATTPKGSADAFTEVAMPI
jgi:hypothetical protein